MLTQEEIQQRASSYGCCSLNSLYSYVQARIYGDQKCLKENWNTFIYLRWAQTKMCDPCLTDQEKTEIAKRADCLCNPCACEPAVPELDCTITPAFEVIDAIPFDELPAEPEGGDSYYIIDGDFTGRIAVWDADESQWTYTIVGINNIVEDEEGDLWINYGDGPGPLFPDVTLTLVGNDVWEAVSQSPQITGAGGRFIQLLGYGFTVPQQGYVLWEGNEADLPLNINLFGLPFVELRIRYRLANGCEYLSDVVTTVPDIDPDTGEPECGVVDVETEVLTGCEPPPPDGGIPLGQWGVLVTTSNNEGFPILRVDYTTPEGTFEAGNPAPGIYTCGPISIEDDPGPMTITLVNAQNPECNIQLEGSFEPDPCCPDGSVTLILGEPSEETAFATGSSSGYYSVVNDGGAPQVFTSEDTAVDVLTDGTYCIYASDEEGNPSGVLEGLFGFEQLNIIDAAWDGLGEGGTFGQIVFNPSGFGSENLEVPVFQGATSLEINPTYDLAGKSIVIEDGDWSALETLTVSSGNSSGPVLLVPPTSIQAVDGVSLGGDWSSAGMDALAEALNPLVVGTITDDLGTATVTPTAASQAARQALYDGGWTLPASWLTDLVT